MLNETQSAVQNEHTRQLEQLFCETADLAPAMLWITDPSGYCTYLSRGWYEFTGQDKQEGEGLGWTNAIHPEDRDAAGKEFLSASRDRRNYEIDFRLRRADGSYRWVVDTGKPFFENDVFSGFVGSVTDIDDRVRAEQALRQSEERLALAVDAAELGTFYCPLPFGEILWNDKCKEHFWLTADASVDIDLFYAIIHVEDRETTKRAIERSIENNVHYETEYRTVSSDGEIRWVEAKGRAYYDPAGNATRFDGITIDITERKRLADRKEQLLVAEREAREIAEKNGRMKDEFLATLSHELRTPLNVIMGWAQILQMAPPDQERLKQGLETIQQYGWTQAQLIDDLLDMSKIISGKVTLDLQIINVDEITNRALETVRAAAAAKNITLHKTSISSEVKFNGDPNRFQQILWNLLSNAVKFTPSNGWVSIDVYNDEEQIFVEVKDSGQGIKPEFLPYVFERFRQQDSSITRRSGGLGLGLAIVKQLVELHGGTVSVESSGEEQGSAFKVTFPSRIMAKSDMSTENNGRGANEVKSQKIISPDFQGIKILIVDDNQHGRELVVQIFQIAGAEIRTASSGEEALLILESHKPDLIICDIGMPDMDGYDFIRMVRASGTSKIPALALTAFAGQIDRERALNAGFELHISKPFEPNMLLRACSKLLGSINT